MIFSPLLGISPAGRGKDDLLALGGFLLIVCSCKFVYFAARFSLKTPPPVKVLGWFVDFINSWFVGHASISKNNKSLLDSHSLVAIMTYTVKVLHQPNHDYVGSEGEVTLLLQDGEVKKVLKQKNNKKPSH